MCRNPEECNQEPTAVALAAEASYPNLFGRRRGANCLSPLVSPRLHAAGPMAPPSTCHHSRFLLRSFLFPHVLLTHIYHCPFLPPLLS